MTLGATIIVGFALAMDAFAVTIANAFAYPDSSRGRSYMAPVAFAVFQGVMPVIGYLIGNALSDIIASYSGIVTFVILAIIGANMIREGIKELRADKNGDAEAEAGKSKVRQLGFGTIVLQAIATSIDALAVGVTFATGTLSIGVAATIIAVMTLAVCTVAWLIGRKFGHILGARAQLLGGVVLVIIAIKALL